MKAGSIARQASPLFAVALLTISACSQHAQNALPATAAVARPVVARPASALSQSVKVQFPSPIRFTTEGFAPSVALLSPSTVIEEHQEKADLYYRFGTIAHDAISWGPPVSGGYGQGPSIAASGTTIVDLHATAYDGLNYRVGAISGTQIAWGKSSHYDDGATPHIAFAGANTLVEVHSGGNGNLWYHLATVDPASKTVDFHGNAKFLDYGYYPSVASNGNGVVIELHAGSSSQFYHIGRINATTNSVDWDKTSHEIPYTTSSVSSVAWSPQGYIVISYLCSSTYPFNIYYLCTQTGTLNPDNTTVSWFGLSKSSYLEAVNNVSTAISGQTAVTVLGSNEYITPFMEYATSQLLDRADWERDYLHADTTDKSLHQIVFPASHDAGMFEDHKGGSGLAGLTQDENIYGQLASGVRYFDFRPDKDLRFWHGPSPTSVIHVQGGSVITALADIVRFMHEGHHEVVIIKWSHFAFTDNSQYSILLHDVQTVLDPWLYVRAPGDNRRIADIPLKEFLKAGHGIVIPIVDTDADSTGYKGIYTYRDYESTDNPQNGQFTAFDQFRDTYDYNLMAPDQVKKFENFTGKMLHSPATPCDEFLLSWTLTPPVRIYQYAPYADSQLAAVMAGIQRNKYGQIPNILYVDFVEWADPVSVAIDMNERL